MAQLKWLIWIAILVIVIRMALLERENASKSSSDPVVESVLSDTLTLEEQRLQFKALATQNAIAYYFQKLSGLSSGKTVFIYQDSSDVLTFEISFGNFFVDGVQYLMLSNSVQNGYDKQMFVIDNGQADSLMSFSNSDGSRNDTILDVNGDGRKDWMMFTKSGIRLMLPDSTEHVFKEMSGLNNVCFSPSEKLVRGKLADKNVYFKQVWDGNQLSTIEYLYPHPDNVNWLIKSDSLYDDVKQAKGSTLWYLPKDYRNVDQCIINGGL
jgi:hypothetical protein